MNPRMTESKSVALPLGYSPLIKMGWDIRVELMTSSATNWRPNQLGQSHHKTNGALWGTRTSGLLLRRQLLYPTELTAQFLERVMGIEPTRPAWKAGILPLNYTRMDGAFLSHQPQQNIIHLPVLSIPFS